MRVHIDKIGPDGLDLDEEATTAWLDAALGDDSPFRGAAAGRLNVHLERFDEVVHVRGRVRLELSASCSRCLGPVELQISTPLEVTLFPRGKEPPAGEDGEVAQEDLGVATYEDKQVDLSGVVHDEVLLELPMNPVCDEDCAGLCPTCGQNLNDGDCECAPATDPRWDGLRRLKLD
jgi:uncharacterized protein